MQYGEIGGCEWSKLYFALVPYLHLKLYGIILLIKYIEAKIYTVPISSPSQ